MNPEPQEQAKRFFIKTRKNPADSLIAAVQAIVKNQTKEVFSKPRDILLLNMGAAQAAIWALAETLKITAAQSGIAYLENPVLDEQEPKKAPNTPCVPAGTKVLTKSGFKPVEKAKPKEILVITGSKTTITSPMGNAKRLRPSPKGRTNIAAALTKRVGAKVAKKTFATPDQMPKPKEVRTVTLPKKVPSAPFAYAKKLKSAGKGRTYIAAALAKRFGAKIAKETYATLD